MGRVPRGTVRLCSTRYVKNFTNASAIEHFADMEVMEAIWVVSEMRAGGAYAHSNLAIDTMKRVEARRGAAKATDTT